MARLVAILTGICFFGQILLLQRKLLNGFLRRDFDRRLIHHYFTVFTASDVFVAVFLHILDRQAMLVLLVPRLYIQYAYGPVEARPVRCILCLQEMRHEPIHDIVLLCVPDVLFIVC